MATKWKDTSPWSQRDTDRSTPNEWTLKTGALSISIHHYIGAGKAWFVSCYDVGVEKYDLNTEDPEEAKKLALMKIRGRLKAMLTSLGED